MPEMTDEKYYAEVKSSEREETIKIDRSRNDLKKLDELGEKALKSGKLMDLVVNGATIMSVNKDTLRGIIRVIITGAAAEVEQLKAENEQNAAYAEIYKDICDKYGKNFGALLDKAKALQIENAKLKAKKDRAEKALELACDDAADGCCPYEIYSWDCQRSGICPNQNQGREDSGLDKQCWYEYYMEQAQRLTHKTHGEAEESEAERKK